MILWFSGTGNSEWCAHVVARELNDECFNTFKYIRNKEQHTFISEKPWVFVVPTYAWKMPRVFRDFLKRSTFEGCRDAYVIMTCGMDNGNAQKDNESVLGKLGLAYKGTLEVTLPENYIAMFNVPSSQVIDAQFISAHELLVAAAHKIAQGQTFNVKKAFAADLLKSGIVNAVFYPMYVHAKKFTTTDACIGCGVCASVCPLGAISMDANHPVWRDTCTHCMACISHCPAEAIEYDNKTQGKVRYTAQKCMPANFKVALTACSDVPAVNMELHKNVHVCEGTPIQIQPACEAELAAVNKLCIAEDMSPYTDVENTYVATDSTGEVLGFIRLRIAQDSRVFVNPIITAADARRQGVGRSLMHFASEVYGNLYLVARGSAIQFYRAIGFEEMAWDEVIPELTEDCGNCDRIKECSPKPMKLIAAKQA